jgi:hypothetical protein
VISSAFLTVGWSTLWTQREEKALGCFLTKLQTSCVISDISIADPVPFQNVVFLIINDLLEDSETMPVRSLEFHFQYYKCIS